MDANGNFFAGKVGFVTGAAIGIGRAAALAFARQGASVVVADVSDEGNQETARLIEKDERQAQRPATPRPGELVEDALVAVLQRSDERLIVAIDLAATR